MRQYITIFLVLIASATHAQFSGKITYRDSYVSKNPSISSADFEKFIGSKRELYIQRSFYKDVHYGELESVNLYRGDANRVYRYNIGSDTIFWMDASRDTLSKVLDFKMEESDEIILGMKCKKLTVKSQLGISIYFFNDHFSIDPTDFKNHHLNFWDFYTSKCKSVPLKVIYESGEIILTSTAIKVDPINLRSDIFNIPSGYLKKKF